MKWLALISILANLALAGALLRPRPIVGPAPRTALPGFVASSPGVQVLTQQVESVRKITNAPPSFTWSHVESEDYAAYMANLRRLECPDWLVRELVLADLMRHYRLRALELPDAEPVRWLTYQQQRARDRRRAEAEWTLKVEERAVMLQLTGTYRHEEANNMFDESDLAITFGALTEDQAMEAVSEFMFLNERKEFLERLHHHLLNPADHAGLDAEYDAIKDRLSARLSPPLFEEFWLRLQLLLGSFADDLELPGIQLTGAQLRELIRIRSGLLDPIRWELTDAEKPEGAERNQVDREVQQALGVALGEEVAAQYARSQNPAFIAMHELTEKHQLPAAAAIAVYDIRQAAIDEVRAFVASEEVDEELKLEMRRLIQLESERAVQSALGPGAWEEYRQGDGRWMDRIGGQPPAGNAGGGR